MAMDTLDDRSLGNAIYPLLVEARNNDKRKARRGFRYPFFHATTIETASGNCYAAFSRDISASGIGLLHKMALPLEVVQLATTTESGQEVRIRTQIIRCEPCGDGWFVSGGHFVAETLHDSEKLRHRLRPVLREAREMDERADPTRTRYPCFRPATIILDSGIRFAGFSRDISINSIGLLHDVELPLAEVEINIATERGYAVKVRTEITHCAPCGQGWCLSGGRFASIPTIL
ncbi:MAG: PilZ domain-containing protein [Planctomycetaceae bacterium]|nr:PilZ domain-containing protein [Planctomycetaceae bacterium]